MPTGTKADRPVALQLPATLMERLGIAVGQPAVVYLMGVHAHLRGGVSPLPPYQPGPPCPGIPPCPPGGSWPCPPWSPGMGPAAGSASGQAGAPAPATSEWCPPVPPSQPGGHGGMMMGTTVLNGVLGFAGADYIDLHVPMAGTTHREVLIPSNSIGMILPGGPLV